MSYMKCTLVLLIVAVSTANAQVWPEYGSNPFVISLDQEPAEDSAGGIALGDLNGDGLLDYLFTTSKSIGAYDHSGKKLWVLKESLRRGGSAESVGLPGHNHPRTEAHDIDADGVTEVMFLRDDGEFVVLNGRSGEIESVWRPKVHPSAKSWEAFTVCNLRGTGDFDVIFEACPTSGAASKRGQMRGTVLSAFAFTGLKDEPLWSTDGYWPQAHSPLRVADVDLDGLDEVVGITFIEEDGQFNSHWNYTDRWKPKKHGSFHLDSLFVYDVLPEEPGMEVVLLEEGANAISLVGPTEYFWRHDYKRQEPQNAAVGEFSLEHPGLETWCRSRYNQHQKPWVFNAKGKLISVWDMDEKSPEGWTESGVEIINTIDWDGGPLQYAAAKERHTEGDVCIFQPVTGEFVRTWKDQAARLMVADVAGDAREEIIVQAGKEIHVYWNEAPSKNPQAPRLWGKNAYKRAKANYNYYSP